MMVNAIWRFPGTERERLEVLFSDLDSGDGWLDVSESLVRGRLRSIVIRRRNKVFITICNKQTILN